MTDLVEFETWENFVDQEGIPTIRGIEFLQDLVNHVNNNSKLSGSGSPEGVISADIGILYWDTAGTAGNILYIKKTGSGSTGWILV